MFNHFQEDEFEAFSISGRCCLLCESTFPSIARAIQHYKEMHLRCTYICGICMKYFHKKENFVVHRTDEHRDWSQLPSTSAAVLMEKPIISERSKGDKLRLVNEFNENRCIDCKISFANVTEISKHFQTEHQFQMLVCPKCERGFTVKASFDLHRCRQSNNKQLRIANISLSYKFRLMREFNQKRCLECNIDFATITEISKHFETKHLKVHVCEACDKGFLFKSLMDKHPCCNVNDRHLSAPDKRLMLMQFRKKRCTSCELTFANSTESANHFEVRHRFKIFACEKCSFETSNDRKFKYHSCEGSLLDRTKSEKKRSRSMKRSLKKSVKKEKRNGSSNSRKHRSTSNKAHDRSTNGSTSHEASNNDGRKYPCCLCPYELPTYIMGLNHYAEKHDLLIFECPAPHCIQLFRRFSKWSRHFLKSHSDVELPANSEFRTLLEDIVSNYWHQMENKNVDS